MAKFSTRSMQSSTFRSSVVFDGRRLLSIKAVFGLDAAVGERAIILARPA
jgi:hypothetical protein